MCYLTSAPARDLEAPEYIYILTSEWDRWGWGGNTGQHFHFSGCPLWNLLNSVPFCRNSLLKCPLSSLMLGQKCHCDVLIHTISSRYFFFRAWWRSRSWLAMSLYWSLSCWHVSSSLERISRASFLLSSFRLHTRYCKTDKSKRLVTSTGLCLTRTGLNTPCRAGFLFCSVVLFVFF